MSPDEGLKNLIWEIYILNFFQKCKLIERIENSQSKSELKEMEKILFKIKKLQDSLLEKALKKDKNKDKISLLKNLLSQSKMSNIKVLEKNDLQKENLDNLLEELWKIQ